MLLYSCVHCCQNDNVYSKCSLPYDHLCVHKGCDFSSSCIVVLFLLLDLQSKWITELKRRCLGTKVCWKLEINIRFASNTSPLKWPEINSFASSGSLKSHIWTHILVKKTTSVSIVHNYDLPMLKVHIQQFHTGDNDSCVVTWTV